MKTLKDLTPDKRLKIQEYKNRARNFYNGCRFNKKHSTLYIKYLYHLVNKGNPVVVFADNPNQYKIYFELLKKSKKLPLIYNLLNKKQNEKKLRSELDSELRSELYSELNSELDSELNSELDSELYSELYSELRSELSSELYSELDSELRSELSSELYSELDSELYFELDSELDSELSSELYSELYSELEKNKSRSHYLWVCSPYTRVYLTWYHYINNVLNVSYSGAKKLNTLYNLFINSSISRCFFAKGYVLVLKNPTKLYFKNSVLHNVNGQAIKYPNYDGMYYVNGRKVEKKLITEKFTKEDVINEKNEDKKAAMITIIKERHGDKGLLDFLGAEIVDSKIVKHTQDYSETIRLYKTKEKYDILQDRHGNMNQPYCWSEIICPSTKQTYLIENSADFTDAVEAVKWLRPNIVPQDLMYNWSSFAN